MVIVKSNTIDYVYGPFDSKAEARGFADKMGEMGFDALVTHSIPVEFNN